MFSYLYIASEKGTGTQISTFQWEFKPDNSRDSCGESALNIAGKNHSCLILRTFPLKGIQSDMERLMSCQRRGNIKYKGCVQFLENP